MAVQNPPEGYRTVTANIIVDGADGVIEFLGKVFEGRERVRMPAPDGKVAHAEVEIGDSVVMVADASEQFPVFPASVHLYLDGVDDAYSRALEAGATSIMEPADQFYGDRSAVVVDPFGNQWSIATHVEDVSEEEMDSRMTAIGQPDS